MSAESIAILAGVAVAALGILILSLGKRLARYLLVLGGLMVVGAVAFALLAQAAANRQVARATTGVARAAEIAAAGQATTSAALSIILFLTLAIVGIVLFALSAGVAWLLWQKHQRQTRYQEMLAQAQVYATMSGIRPPIPARPRPAAPQMPAGPPVIIVSGAAPQYPYQVIDLSALQGQGKQPLTGLLPSEEEWE